MNTPATSLQNERANILDILRGIALLGIILANYPVISLWVFQGPPVWDTMPTAALDGPISFIHFTFLDGKFYTLFSLLFGIGFSIILLNAQQKNKNGLAIFYRRLFILLIIGLFHSLFVWIGDILLLYAIMGMFLPLFRNVSDKKLLIIAVALILSPIVIDTLKSVSDNQLNLSNPIGKIHRQMEAEAGITDANFGTWVIEHKTYPELLKYNKVEFFMRWYMLINSNRPLKVFGIFLLGLYAGRKLIYLRLEENRQLFKTIQKWGYIIGLPLSFLYAYFELTGGTHFAGAAPVFTTVLYALSVVPLSLAYTSSICLWYSKNKNSRLLNAFAAPGRMALTNYFFQSIIGIIIFYGIGFGYGGSTGLAFVLLIATGVYLLQLVLSNFWLKHFSYGPFEWIWRMLTYGKYLPIKK